jgi:hypothetical protein
MRGFVKAVGDNGIVRALVVVTAIAAINHMARAFGMGWDWRMTAVLSAGAIARQLFLSHPFRVMTVTGIVVLALWKPSFVVFEVALLAVLYVLRHRRAAFWGVLLGVGVVIPKTLYKAFYYTPEVYNWVSQTALTHILLIAVLWWVERARKVQDQTFDPSFAKWMTLFAAPTNPLNPLNLGPTELWRTPSVDHRAVGRSLVLLGSKALALHLIGTHLGAFLLDKSDLSRLDSLDFFHLWAVVAVSYVKLTLWLSGTADVVIALLRVFGWPLDSPYRWALCAWNPVELWRRWSIYNRKYLLKCVYFPLGGSEKRRYFNVMMTFWASALVLHSGWVGSLYWEVGAPGWRDQGAYFTLQGLAVCACLYLWQWRGKDPRSDRSLRLSAVRIGCTVATQAYSAWAHVIVLAPALGWAERWKIMGRCVGLGW